MPITCALSGMPETLYQTMAARSAPQLFAFGGFGLVALRSGDGRPAKRPELLPYEGPVR
ncbi:hypothetical protein OG585_07095 [Streptomyces sp. NBC_01340]|uniref:hypothetical protein n=1 Tax=unclassified Streptomyces TaxID=2593676 RepID=UPI0022598B44|nr:MULTISPECIES: hypothetical protein [unclassified Streptomyces]MCX4452515.1 hypothetical protein [Streptomyces sp. NBC_01719]MCX4491875.1 hypothetical protein [Streptomyces sp. NBC_01728]MCX4593625.1 hypothetical protein [Streptomyces sp. NBC_01549]WSI37072.1 hypothetical protein OG585_07095 [Streptomyces sp. NBC_01340]